MSTDNEQKAPTPAGGFRCHWINAVLIASSHNPSIINPEFLRKQRIVPSGWEPVQSIVTPTGSSVLYNSNVRFTTDHTRLEIRQDTENIPGFHNEVFTIASRLLKVLPHPAYKRLGMNWQVSIQKAEPSLWLRERFLVKGAWTSVVTPPIGLSLTLQYQDNSANCNIALAGAVIEQGNERYDAISANVNFDHAVSEPKVARAELAKAESKYAFMMERLSLLTEGIV